MTNEEIDALIADLQEGDSNDAEIDGLTEVVRELQAKRAESPTAKFNLPHVRANLMDDSDGVFVLSWRDVVDTLWEKKIVVDLDEDEMRVFRKCVESGLSCWSEVIELAYHAAVSERPIGGAAARLKKFIESGGDTDVLLEGLAGSE